MKRPAALVALTVLSAVVFAPAANAATRTQAQQAARRSADAYTNHRMGIGGRASLWRASCRHAGSGWLCKVNMNNGQCVGTVQLTGGLRGYGHRIGCME